MRIQKNKIYTFFQKKVEIFFTKMLLIILFYFCSNQLFSQELSFELFYRNELISGIKNKICIVVEEVPCDSIFIVVENAKVKKENGCNYIFTPENRSKVKIDIYKLTKNDTIFVSTKYLRVNDMWPPQSMISGKFNGIISKDELLEAKKIELYSYDLDLDMTRKIKKYEVKIKRGFDKIYTTKLRGNRMPLKLKKQFKNLQTGDMIEFVVYYKSVIYGTVYSEPCVFRIE